MAYDGLIDEIDLVPATILFPYFTASRMLILPLRLFFMQYVVVQYSTVFLLSDNFIASISTVYQSLLTSGDIFRGNTLHLQFRFECA